MMPNNKTSNILLNTEFVVWAVIATEVLGRRSQYFKITVGPSAYESSNEDAAQRGI